MTTDLSRVVLITISFQLLSDQDVLQLSFFASQTPEIITQIRYRETVVEP